ncbi:hypothetical protein HMPREF9123_2890 [Neisseria bacilliformis ATCC BAA-1200]|uniref:Uncharacterized protein n=1 Tax=Neisseria bacilliformis ATCC BAA-1200 TaxID=888742 RepID=F2BGN3_9NEIS|nr:hypothetical protein HMPREF9123_2890 [Neisseria bacilliformis ATCC BAA-1200]
MFKNNRVRLKEKMFLLMLLPMKKEKLLQRESVTLTDQLIKNLCHQYVIKEKMRETNIRTTPHHWVIWCQAY